MINNPKRRTFLASSIATGAGLTILPGCKSVDGGVVTTSERSTEKLNLAVIGAHGRARQHYSQLKTQNIVALCDVNAKKLALAAKEFPKAKHYTDWRKCLEQSDLDGVVICTPDHHHAFISIWAMNRGLHVYCEKALGDCVHEARAVRDVYLQNKDKLATQHGTQRHAVPNFTESLNSSKEVPLENLRMFMPGEAGSIIKPPICLLPAPRQAPSTGNSGSAQRRNTPTIRNTSWKAAARDRAA